ncbi:unnamed protein product [Symbiodinium natans]|uniref:Serine-threonine/tyrosine-protein kinase catalytic domain-containing protein n=1 Tax=Symbiodinium natans TaxID=878477 RepID=A0A812UKR6_9DINO|nr:unnamed protein product [Symbiodinium natans]
MPSMTEITKGLTPQKLLSGVQPESKRSDMAKILSIFKKHSKEIHVYGGSIIGAGKMLYQSKSQKPYNWFQCGVAARASNITMYFGCIFKLSDQVVKKIGPKCTHGVGCLHFKSLAEVNLAELEALMKRAFVVKEFRAPGAKAPPAQKRPAVFASSDDDPEPYNLKADVFSFGILMYEVMERQLPYSERFGNDVSDPRISLHVCMGLRPEVRSSSSEDSPEVREAIIKLMQRAWDNEPDDRPDFQELEDVLQGLWDSLGGPKGR